MILLIDNYDSFVYNLFHFISELGAEVVVYRNDVLATHQALAMQPEAIVLSPGPGRPCQAGICLDLIKAASEIQLPILGVCLGHQAIALAFGAQVVQSALPVHGKTSPVHHQGQGLLSDLPSPLRVTRYHSLIVQNLPPCLRATAHTDDGILMSLSHLTLPVHGVQFHPESIATEHGHALLRNFLSLVPSFSGPQS